MGVTAGGVAAAPDGPVAVGTVLLTEVRAALAAGAAPGPAFVAAVEVAAGTPEPPRRVRRRHAPRHAVDVAAVARTVRLGTSIADVAETVDTGDASADLLVRALGVVERAGAGAVAAVDQVLAAVRDEAALARLLRVRTTQARGTALVLTLIPALVWVLLVSIDGAALGFYATPAGAMTGVPALGLAAGGQWWSRRLVRRAAGAAAAADPLAPPAPPWRPVRGTVVALPALVLLGVTVEPGAGLLAAAVAGGLTARPARNDGPAPVDQAGRQALPGRGWPTDAPRRASGGAAETVELVAVALQAGMPPGEAVAVVAPLAPPAARTVLTAAAGRLRAGWQADGAFTGTGLAVLGAALAACERWGAPADEVLRRLARDLRADRRAAAEQAAERTQLTLIFPTTLLTLPAFVLGVVPPLLWTAFGR